MNLARLYSQLIGTCEARNGKPKKYHHHYKKPGFEIHHITPRSIRGHWFKNINDPSNLVYLTPREHFLAHRILARIYGGGLAYAFMRMCNSGGRYKTNSRAYETARKGVADYMRNRVITPETRERMREAQRNINHSITKAQREAMIAGIRARFISEDERESRRIAMLGNTLNLGRSFSVEHRAKIGEAHRGKLVSEETKLKMSDFQKSLKLTCPHCGITGGAALYRWHFDNCPQITGRKLKFDKVNCEHCGKSVQFCNMDQHLESCRALGKQKIGVCPHCGKSGALQGLKRWHFDNCKHKPS
ncbi:hypothetical protein XY27_000800 [Salmonella enterica subsp. enterica]|nr:hypothetical protein [Salmonella enterica subsp. enterica]EDU9171444.1 hypothetical protein [Salmonella enterica subsp. enterica serovar Kisangani]